MDTTPYQSGSVIATIQHLSHHGVATAAEPLKDILHHRMAIPGDLARLQWILTTRPNASMIHAPGLMI